MFLTLLAVLFLQGAPININELSHQTPVATFQQAEATPVAIFHVEQPKGIEIKATQPKPVATLHQPVLKGIVLEPSQPTVIATFKIEK